MNCFLLKIYYGIKKLKLAFSIEKEQSTVFSFLICRHCSLQGNCNHDNYLAEKEFKIFQNQLSSSNKLLTKNGCLIIKLT